MSSEATATEPEDVTRLVVERLNAGDATGVAALYEPEAVMAYPGLRSTIGRDAIRVVYQQMVDAGVKFSVESPLPAVKFEDLALTSTRSADNTGVRVQVLRRQPDGSWLRIIDRPEVPREPGVVFMGRSRRPTTGSVPWTREPIVDESIVEPPGSAQITAAASAMGGCVRMAVTVAFTPTTATRNPYLPYGLTSNVRQVDVNGYVGWIGTAGTSFGQPTLQLTVELPQANGQMRDLAFASSYLSADQLLTIVSQGISECADRIEHAADAD